MAVTDSTTTERPVRVPLGVSGTELDGDLSIPEGVEGVILFAHGSGSSRHSPRNRYVAAELNRSRFATLLLDLLTPREEEADRYTGHLRFDINLLTERLSAALDWLHAEPSTRLLPVGLFGASTGGAAALTTAAG